MGKERSIQLNGMDNDRYKMGPRWAFSRMPETNLGERAENKRIPKFTGLVAPGEGDIEQQTRKLKIAKNPEGARELLVRKKARDWANILFIYLWYRRGFSHTSEGKKKERKEM